MTTMNFPSTPQLWNQIAMILAWYWDKENESCPIEVAEATGLIVLVFDNEKLTVDQYWLLFDALNSYRESEPNSWNDDLEAFYKIVHSNYWRLTLPEGEKPPETP